jgi:hypothetical protein
MKVVTISIVMLGFCIVLVMARASTGSPCVLPQPKLAPEIVVSVGDETGTGSGMGLPAISGRHGGGTWIIGGKFKNYSVDEHYLVVSDPNSHGNFIIEAHFGITEINSKSSASFDRAIPVSRTYDQIVAKISLNGDLFAVAYLDGRAIRYY